VVSVGSGSSFSAEGSAGRSVDPVKGRLGGPLELCVLGGVELVTSVTKVGFFGKANNSKNDIKKAANAAAA
jgi:hypothetical protein